MSNPPRVHQSTGNEPPDYRYYQPAAPTSTPSGIDALSGMQIALTVLALAALPITSWLYIANYVETKVDTAIERHDAALQQTIKAQTNTIDGLQDYAFSLCIGVRKLDPQFSCYMTSSRRYLDRYRMPQDR